MVRCLFYILPLVSLVLFQSCHGYPSGAPLNACQEMIPYHPPTTTSGKAPFEIEVTQTSYTPGEKLTGKIYSPSGVKFRGILIEARLADGSSTSPVGEFIATDNNTHTNCGTKNKQGLTHNDNSNKTSVSFTWQAPEMSQGDVHFRLTVVESYNVSRFWLGIYSNNITDFCQENPASSNCSDVTTVEPITGTEMHTSTPEVQSTTPSSNDIVWDTECGKTKGCFPDCLNGCKYLVKWQKGEANGDDVTHFEVEMKVESSSNSWVAVGFGPTKNMDGTDVVACLLKASGTSLESSYNDGHSNMLYKETTVGLSNMRASLNADKISFSFMRQNNMANMDHYRSMSDEMYLQIAQGPLQQGIKQQHTDIPVRSSSKINFLKAGVAKESDSASTLIKLHGSLMVVAWILLSTIGVVAARHCKDMMQNKLMCNVKYWFVIHRTLMCCVVLCVISAMVIVFYENGGFQKITSVRAGMEYTKAHPYLGIVVTILALANPLMAILRPSPDHRSRPLFNWAHFTVGTAAHILAVITVFLGIHLSKAKVNEYAQDVVIVYYIVFVLVQFILEVHKRCKTNSVSTNEGDYSTFSNSSDIKIPFKNVKKTNVEEADNCEASEGQMVHTAPKTKSSLPSTMLILLSVSAFVLTVLLIVMICDPKRISS